MSFVNDHTFLGDKIVSELFGMSLEFGNFPNVLGAGVGLSDFL